MPQKKVKEKWRYIEYFMWGTSILTILLFSMIVGLAYFLIPYVARTTSLITDDNLRQLNQYFNSALMQVYTTLFGFLLVALGFSVHHIRKRMRSRGRVQIREYIEHIGEWGFIIIWTAFVSTILGFIISYFVIIQTTRLMIDILIGCELLYVTITALLVAIVFAIYLNFFQRLFK
jgi:hypothetical protein